MAYPVFFCPVEKGCCDPVNMVMSIKTSLCFQVFEKSRLIRARDGQLLLPHDVYVGIRMNR